MKTIQVQYIDTTEYIVNISQDTEAEDPLKWTTPEERGAWFIMSHSRYDLPNELDVDFNWYDSMQEVAEAYANGRPYKFVNWYEHSGIVVSLQDHTSPSDRWDAGIAGVIIGDTEEMIRLNFADWKAYIEGDVYNIDIETADGRYVDGLCGILGYDNVKAVIEEIIPGAEYEENWL